MIKKITIKNVASYDAEGVVFDDLRKVNIIYGGNGTGKTTISRVLDASRWDGAYPDCSVEWDGEIRSVEVYNREFKEKNLKEHLPGVFTLGEEWVKLEEQMDAIKPKREAAAKKALESKERVLALDWRIKVEEKALQDSLWKDLYVPHKDLKELVKKYARKAAFAKHIKKAVAERDRKQEGDLGRMATITDSEKWRRVEIRDVEELRRRYKELYATELGNAGNSDTGNYVEAGRQEFEREMLEYDFWQYLAAKADETVKRSEAEIKGLERKQKRLKKAEETATKELNEIDFALEGADNMKSSMQPAIDRINEGLMEAGFIGFSIQPSPNSEMSYQIQREDGTYVEDTLSDGEATLITFLYYMERAKGALVEIAPRGDVVLVIDDPISSLDTEATYEVSTIVRKAMEEARSSQEDPGIFPQGIDPWVLGDTKNRISQVIVLTHNRAFHRLVSDKFRRRNTHYWELYKENGVSKVEDYGTQNPVRGEYEEIWYRMKEEMKQSNSVALANLMRRIIETYFVSFGGYNKVKLFAGEYTKNIKDKMAMVSLAKWFDEGSHAAMGDMSLSGGRSMNSKYMEKLKELFEIMGQGEHYRMMMREE